MSNKQPYNDLIGDILSNSDDRGQIDHLDGAGKPLSKEYFSGDTFQHFQKIAKDAGYKPYWLKLQHEVKALLEQLIAEKEQMDSKEVKKFVKTINQKIALHNKNCPPPFLKGKISAESVSEAIKFWQ